MPGMKTT